MSRYAEVEQLIANLDNGLWGKDWDKALAETIIRDAPSIDIVRCGECKHWRTYETWSECELWTDDPYESAKTKANDFCSYGERSEKPNNLERSSE